MQYKTITLELLRERPALYERLRSTKRLLTAMDAYASDLKSSHDEWKDRISRANPGRDPIQVAIEALEMAIQELQERLPSESPRDEAEPLSLDGAMDFIRRHTPTA
jgi:chromosome segregation ATPase